MDLEMCITICLIFPAFALVCHLLFELVRFASVWPNASDYDRDRMVGAGLAILLMIAGGMAAYGLFRMN